MEEQLACAKSLIRKITKRFNKQSFLSNELIDFSEFSKKFYNIIDSEKFISGNHILGKFALENINSALKIFSDQLKTFNKFSHKKILSLINCTLRKLNVLNQMFDSSLKLDINDFDCLPDDHPRKIAVRNITTTVIVAPSQVVDTQLNALIKMYNISKAICMRATETNESFFRGLLVGWLPIYYSLFYKKAKGISEIFNSNPSKEVLKLFWNITENKLMRKLLPLKFRSINFHEMIFIPRIFPFVTDEPGEINNSFVQTGLHQMKYSFEYDEAKIGIRILSKHPIPEVLQEKSGKSPRKFEGKKFERLIIHFHGGGYIGQSTFSHQNYLRNWAMEIDEPIFSIEYRLAPKYPFPCGLDDAWQAYNWLLTYSESLFDISPSKIILIGDSAGASLSTSVTLKALTSKIRPPDSLLLIYPAFNFHMDYVSKAAFISINDEILPYGAFFTVRDCYITNPDDYVHPLISQVFAPQEMLVGFPYTEVMIPLNDPLCGDSFRFVDKIIRAGGDVKVREYPNVVHGSLSFGSSGVVPVFSRIYEDSLELIKGLLAR